MPGSHSAEEARRRTVVCARGWQGVRFRHQGQTRRGVDCIGLLMALGRELGTWNFTNDDPLVKEWLGYPRIPHPQRLVAALDSHLTRIPIADMRSADIALFRGRNYPQHLGLIDGDRVIHSYEPFGKVDSTRLDARSPLGGPRHSRTWRQAIVVVYLFPGVEAGLSAEASAKVG